jgi:hypothetical protein
VMGLNPGYLLKMFLLYDVYKGNQSTAIVEVSCFYEK